MHVFAATPSRKTPLAQSRPRHSGVPVRSAAGFGTTGVRFAGYARLCCWASVSLLGVQGGA
eukprot:9473032-Pyramimonas_sp.AAC.1